MLNTYFVVAVVFVVAIANIRTKHSGTYSVAVAQRSAQTSAAPTHIVPGQFRVALEPTRAAPVVPQLSQAAPLAATVIL